MITKQQYRDALDITIAYVKQLELQDGDTITCGDFGAMIPQINSLGSGESTIRLKNILTYLGDIKLESISDNEFRKCRMIGPKTVEQFKRYKKELL